MNRPSDTLRLAAPAKLNLFLRITGQRADGYHELQTLFQLLDYGDSVTLSTAERDIRLATPLPGVADSDNLAIRAAQALARASGCEQGAIIGIEKRLPMGGGLGGGSSNAASVLLGLNALWQTGLSVDALAELGRQLGADVPLFVRGHSSLAEGIGEQLYPVELAEHCYLVVWPGIEVATATIFGHTRLTRDSLAIRIPAVFQQAEISRLDISELALANQLTEQDIERNDCEAIVRELYPEVDQALNWLGQYAKAQLTGTGSCLYARFDSAAAAQTVLDELPSQYRGFISHGVNRSPALQDIADWQA